jgi:hypothetical protein
MLKKLLLLSFALIFVSNIVNAGPRITKAQLDRSYGVELTKKVVGDGVCGVKGKNTYNSNWHPVINNSKFNDSPSSLWDTISIYRKYLTIDNIYDMQSNGTPYEIIQDPNNPNKIHVITMYAPPGNGPGYADRRTKYWYSVDKGTSFTYIGNVPEVKTGYAMVTLTPTGIEMVGTHVTPSTPHYYLDAASGLGSWTDLYNNVDERDYVWVRCVFSSVLTNPVKFVSIASPNGRDSCFWTACTSISPAPGTFGQWNFCYSDQAETYGIARGADGRIGITYLVNNALLASEVGDVFFMESTDNGSTFGSPLKIFDADVSPSGDSLGCLRGLSIVYQGNNPCIVFETPRLSATGWWPTLNCKMRFWSKSLPGSDPNRSIVIVDTNNTPFYSFYIPTSNTTYDVWATYSRPSIGRSITGDGLFVTFMSPAGLGNSSDGTIFGGVDTTNYMANYILYSENGGASWFAPKRITPIDTTTVGGSYTKMKEYINPSVSPFNDNDANNWYMNMVVIEDSIPGTYLYHTNNGEPRSKQLFMRIKLPRTVGINNISGEIPEKYAMKQNYPNPFNPVTSIRFSLPKVSVVTLKVYDITGKLVSTLVNNETVSVGEKEVRFDASNLSSGVYFYSIKAGDFSDTRKMVVVK